MDGFLVFVPNPFFVFLKLVYDNIFRYDIYFYVDFKFIFSTSVL